MAIVQVVTARDTVLHVKEILRKHEYLFKFCRLLNPLHFVDTEAAVKAHDFMLALKLNSIYLLSTDLNNGS